MSKLATAGPAVATENILNFLHRVRDDALTGTRTLLLQAFSHTTMLLYIEVMPYVIVEICG